MRFTCISGDSQDRVFGLLDLANIVNDGRYSTKRLLDNKNKFDLTPTEIETIKNMQSLLERCWRAFVWEIRVPTE